MWHQRLLRFAMRQLRDADGAKDVVQEVWLVVAKSLPGLRDSRLFPRWIHQVTQNKCANWINGRVSHRARFNDAFDSMDCIAATDDRNKSSDSIEVIRNAFQNLSAERRLILSMIYVDELSVEEISTRLGIPVGTVKSRLYHAREELKLWIQKE